MRLRQECSRPQLLVQPERTTPLNRLADDDGTLLTHVTGREPWRRFGAGMRSHTNGGQNSMSTAPFQEARA